MFFGFWIALIYGHFYFGYGIGSSNSGEESEICYAPQDKNIEQPWSFQTSKAIPDDYHNVNDNFILCARFGYYTYISVTVIFFLFQFVDGTDGNKMEAIFSCLALPIAALYVTNLLMVMIYRWRHAGKICSGDYLPNKEIFSDE